ncbi:MAG: heme-binding protein [Hyphomicrobiales bacterium]|nr:heme-binding protein [Hyphomicrobiales bacterium]
MAKRATLSIVAVALAAGTLTIANAQVITHRDVGVRMGLAVAVAALDQCEAEGNHVSVAVVDRAGRLRVFLQSDRANPHNLELARRKAYTARTFGRSSADWTKRTAEIPELAAQRELADVIALRGGVPIKIGDETIGAVGVSGASSEGDEKCALVGLTKVADQLK